jgi:hypothetical protein
MDNGKILRRSAATCAALVAAALAAPGAAQQGADVEPTNVADGPRSCLPHPTIDRTKILNGKNIVFVTRDETIYNNALPKQCPNLNRRSLVNYGIQNGRICAGDRFQVLWENRPGNYLPAALCQLGNFVPISEAELEDLVAMTEQDPERRRRGRSSREAVTTEQVEVPQAETAPAAGETPPAE